MGEHKEFRVSDKNLKQRSNCIMLRVLHHSEIERFGNKLAAHGDYMKMFAETGIFGGTGYLIILFTKT